MVSKGEGDSNKAVECRWKSALKEEERKANSAKTSRGCEKEAVEMTGFSGREGGTLTDRNVNLPAMRDERLHERMRRVPSHCSSS